jgi:hypothetical protein
LLNFTQTADELADELQETAAMTSGRAPAYIKRNNHAYGWLIAEFVLTSTIWDNGLPHDEYNQYVWEVLDDTL